MKSLPEPITEFFDTLAAHWDDDASEASIKAAYCLESLPIKEGDRVIDVGCGTGVAVPVLYGLCKRTVLGLDISGRMAAIARSKFPPEMATFKGQNLYSYRDSGFDALVCYNSYPHFLDKEGFAKKASELLKPGGLLAICHSCGREELDKCHTGAMHVSRSLDGIEEEFAPYKEQFDLIESEDNESSYRLIMRRK